MIRSALHQIDEACSVVRELGKSCINCDTLEIFFWKIHQEKNPWVEQNGGWNEKIAYEEHPSLAQALIAMYITAIPVRCSPFSLLLFGYQHRQ